MEKQITVLIEVLQPLIDNFSGSVAMDIRNIQDGSLFAYNENHVYPTASTIKVFILGAVLEQIQNGQYELSDEITMEHNQQAGGSGVLKEFSSGSKYPIKDVAMAMIILSDNTATNMLIDLVGGVEVVNNHIKKFGLTNTELRNRIDFEAIGDDVHNLAVATAEEFAEYLTLVADNKVFNPELTQTMIDIMSRQQYLDQFPRYIPYNPYARELNVKQDIQISNKTGFYTGVRCDVGYLFLPEGKFVFSVLTKDCADQSFDTENEGSVFVGKIGKEIYDYIIKNY